MSADKQLELALSEWQRKHRIADGDPMMALLDLVHLAIQNPPKPNAVMASLPPTFHEFRATMEFLESQSKVFANQSTTLIGELRTFTLTVQRLNENHTVTLVLILIVALAGGIGIGWLIWKPHS